MFLETEELPNGKIKVTKVQAEKDDNEICLLFSRSTIIKKKHNNLKKGR